MKKSLFIVLSVLFSVTVFAHSGHTPFEFISLIDGLRHYLSGSYHIVSILITSLIFAVSGIVVYKRKQIIATTLMLFAFFGSMLSIGLLLS